MHRRTFALSVLVIALAVVTSGCARQPIIMPTPIDTSQATPHGDAPSEQPSQLDQQSAARPATESFAQGQKIVFDMGHNEIFGVDDTSQLGQSQAVARMREAGFNVVVNTDTITAKDLHEASGLILAGPMRPLLAEEYTAVNDFVRQGGTMLLTIHVPYPVMSVPGHWGLPAVPSVVMGAQPLAGETDPGVLVADQIENDRLTKGVKQILVVSGWPIQPSKNAKVVVKTAPTSWIDANDNGKGSSDEVGSYGIVGTAGLGKGRVIVFGDDAIFANIAIDKFDNLKLLDNVLKVMASGLES